VVVRSGTGGNEWSTAAGALPGIPGGIAFGADPAEAWIAAGPVVFHTESAGETFTPTTPLPEAGGIESVAAAAHSGGVVWAQAAGGAAYRTTDGGTTWRRYTDTPGTAAFAGPAMAEHGDPARLQLTFFHHTDAGRLAGVLTSADHGD